MAIANYTDLKAAVATWLHRSDLTATIVDLITIGEAYLNRTIRAQGMFNVTTLGLPLGSSAVTDIAGKGPIRSLRHATYGELPHRSIDDVVNAAAANTGKTGTPKMWCAVGNATQFDITADVAYTYTVTRDLRLLIATDTTNWLLTNHPDTYLYASLAAAAPLLRDDPRVSLWVSLRNQAIKDVNSYYQQGRNITLRTPELATLSGAGAYNITEG